MAKTKHTHKRAKRAKNDTFEVPALSALVDAARPLLTVRDWATCGDKSPNEAAIYELPYVRNIEPVPENGGSIDWWSVPLNAFNYWHQGEEVGRTFFEETGRQFLKHGEPIEFALTCALKKMGGQHTNSGVGSGFMATLAHYALIGFASLDAVRTRKTISEPHRDSAGNKSTVIS